MSSTESHVSPLARDALRIWRAGVEAVRADRLVKQAVQATGTSIRIGNLTWDSGSGGRLCVVGGGKAGTGMVQGVEQLLPSYLLDKTSGWVNVPADCVQPTTRIVLHAARPAHINEPRVEGQAGAEQILKLVSELTERDLCLVLLSGGGSALLPAPCEGLTLDDKLAVTRLLMNSGATINELNAVRSQLSRIKGGGLLRACRAGTMVALIISDVSGDPLDVIASGPTIPSRSTPQQALEILERFDPQLHNTPGRVVDVLRQRCARPDATLAATVNCLNVVIGNNQTAVDAAARAAEELGYDVLKSEADRGGIARAVGAELARWGLEHKGSGKKVCCISGGEPIVKLVPAAQPRKGGRNQELALAAAVELSREPDGICVLSGGTDGEDGPTDAAGAFVDADIIAAAQAQHLDPHPFLEISNSYPFFEATGGLIQTGPTHTNVMDLRVVLVDDCNSARSNDLSTSSIQPPAAQPPQPLNPDAVAAYDYFLPPELIARFPLAKRDASRLLVVTREDLSLQHRRFHELPELLQQGDLLVVNQTRVIPARLRGVRTATGGKWEGLFLREELPQQWRLIGQTRGNLQPGETLTLMRARKDNDPQQRHLVLRIKEKCDNGEWLVTPLDDRSALELLELFGTLPLPHYMQREAEHSDAERYQTSYAKSPGAVAAPTAGLHFTPELFEHCRQRGVEIARVTLHVGLGTFRPMAVSRLSEHIMHSEWCDLPQQTVDMIERTKAGGGRIVAVGTTTVRTLESAAAQGPLRAWSGETNLFIRPPYEFQVVDALITNFHLPKSTLLVLVSTFTGRELIQQAYAAAIEERYRFYSYGDAMLIQ